MRPAWAKLTVRRMMVLVAVFAGATWLVVLDLRRSRTINPPDIVEVKVDPALPGRPIKGERLVRPDGTITLGYYGQVHVAGLSIGEARAKIVSHLRRHLSDEALGLVEVSRDAEGKRALRRRLPEETDRASVRITSKNAVDGIINRMCHNRLLWNRIWGD